MAIDQRRTHGELGERIAEEHLAHRGYTIVARNFRTRYGEIDLVAVDSDALVFCEVKTRVAGSQRGPDGPLDAIGTRKRNRLRMMAGQWLAEHSDDSRPHPRDLRFDAVGVVITPAGRLLALEHMENAF
jgi:putative endonuclease